MEFKALPRLKNSASAEVFVSHVNFEAIAAFTPVFIKVYIRNTGSALPNVCPAK